MDTIVWKTSLSTKLKEDADLAPIMKHKLQLKEAFGNPLAAATPFRFLSALHNEHDLLQYCTCSSRRTPSCTRTTHAHSSPSVHQDAIATTTRANSNSREMILIMRS